MSYRMSPLAPMSQVSPANRRSPQFQEPARRRTLLPWYHGLQISHHGSTGANPVPRIPPGMAVDGTVGGNFLNIEKPNAIFIQPGTCSCSKIGVQHSLATGQSRFITGLIQGEASKPTDLGMVDDVKPPCARIRGCRDQRHGGGLPHRLRWSQQELSTWKFLV